MLATKRQRPGARMLDRWAISVLLDVGAIKNAKSTVGCGIALIRMRASEPLI